MNAPNFHSVPCSHCHAEKNKPCIDDEGNERLGVHVDRTETYFKALK